MESQVILWLTYAFLYGIKTTEELIYYEFITNFHSPPELNVKPAIRRRAEYLLKYVVSFPFHESYSTRAVGEGGFSHNHQYPSLMLLTKKWNCCGFYCVTSCGAMIQRELCAAAQTLFFRDSQHQGFSACVLPELLVLVYVV